MMKAAFNFVFGPQLEILSPPEEERGRAGALDGTPVVYNVEEWDVLAFAQPHFSLTGQVPTHLIPSWR
ncbi:hypothetical protein C8Q77DRAFT_1161596 [Trametes polyzona]|nr:hypothetical protein C8Q77DRAFT_1161596 [Trametes polyzona]